MKSLSVSSCSIPWQSSVQRSPTSLTTHPYDDGRVQRGRQDTTMGAVSYFAKVRMYDPSLGAVSIGCQFVMMFSSRSRAESGPSALLTRSRSPHPPTAARGSVKNARLARINARLARKNLGVRRNGAPEGAPFPDVTREPRVRPQVLERPAPVPPPRVLHKGS
jgi:hypothetical protein